MWNTKDDFQVLDELAHARQLIAQTLVADKDKIIKLLKRER